MKKPVLAHRLIQEKKFVYRQGDCITKMSKTKYICKKCGSVIDEDDLDAVMQWDGEGAMGGYHPVEDKCPECGGTDVVEAEECCCCAESFDKENDMIEVDDFWYCKECAGRIHDAYYLAWGRFEEAKGAANG